MQNAAIPAVEMTAGNKLRIYRALHGLEQKELGQYLGGTRQSVAKWEKGIYLPTADFLSSMNLYEWIRTDSLLPPQLFVPTLPNINLRAQSVNQFSTSIRELLTAFCHHEKIAQKDIEIVIFDDGEVIRLGHHFVIVLGSLRHIKEFLIGDCRPAKYASGEGSLVTTIKEKDMLFALLKKSFDISSDLWSRLNKFRITADLWEESLSLLITVKLKGVGPAHRADILSEITTAVSTSLANKYQGSVPHFSVSVELEE